MENVNHSYQNDAVSELEQGFLDILPSGYEGYADIGELSSLGVDALLGEIAGIAEGGRGALGSFLLLSLGVSVILMLVGLFRSPIAPTVRGGVTAAAVMAMLAALYPLFCSVGGAMEQMSAFFGALVPILTSFLALGGGAGTALGASSGLSITLWLTGAVGSGLLLPLAAAMLGGGAISTVLGGSSERISLGISRGFKRAVAAVGAVVAGVFALQTYVSVSADSIGMRAAKYAAGGLIPVVGGMVSGALSTLTGGLLAVGGVIGASSVAVIASMALSPLVLLLMYKLALSICLLFLEVCGGAAHAPCISAFSAALDALISVYITTTIIYIFEIIVLIRGGNAIFG